MLARWAMIGGGLVLILLNVIVRLFSLGKHRRVSDFIELDEADAKRVVGRGK
jgi:hypothetical protein